MSIVSVKKERAADQLKKTPTMPQLERSPSTSQTQANGPQRVRCVTCWFSVSKGETSTECQPETIFLYSTDSSIYPILRHTLSFLARREIFQ